MIFKRNKSISPFDQYGSVATKTVPVKDADIPHKYLTTRSSIFLASMIMSLSGIVTKSSNLIVMMGIVAIYLLVWGLAMYYWQSAKYPGANLLANTTLCLLIVSMCQLVGLDFVPSDYTYVIPVVAGTTALSSMPPYKNEEFTRYDLVNEFIIPIVVSLASVAVASVSLIVTNHSVSALIVILASVVLGGLSYVITKTIGTAVFFSSAAMSDYSDIPVASRENLRRFWNGRYTFEISLLVSFIISGVVAYLVDRYLISMSVAFTMLIPFSVVPVYMVAYLIRYRHRDSFGSKILIFESLGAVAFAPLYYMFNLGANILTASSIISLIQLFIILCVIDALIAGMMTFHKRRSVFTDVTPHLDGLPQMLIMFGVILMCVEGLYL